MLLLSEYRALALHQASFKNVAQVVAKEAAAGFIMGKSQGFMKDQSSAFFLFMDSRGISHAS
jgi:Mg/Co/Ni transporter MgtE